MKMRCSESLIKYYTLFIIPFIGIVYDISTRFLGLEVAKIIGIFLKDLIFILLIGFTFLRKKRSIYLDLYILSLFTYLLSSLIWLQDSLEYYELLVAIRNNLIYPCAIFIGWYYFESLKKIDISANYLKVGIIGSILAIMQFYGLYNSYYELAQGGTELWIHGGTVSRIEFTFIQILILTRILFFIESGVKYNFLDYIFITIIFLSILICQSRIALITMPLMIMPFFLNSKKLSNTKKLIIFMIFLLAIITVLNFSNHRIFSNPINFNDPRFSEIIPYALDKFSEQPLLGYGLGSYGSSIIYGSGQEKKDMYHFLDSSFFSLLLQFGLIFIFINILNIIFILRNALCSNIIAIRMVSATIIIYALTFGMFFNSINAWPGGVIIFGLLGYLIKYSEQLSAEVI